MIPIIDKMCPSLESVVRFRVFLLFSTLVFYSDIVCIVYTGHGVSDLEFSPDGLAVGGRAISVRQAILYLLLYLFYMSAGAMLLRCVVEYFLSWPKYKFWAAIKSTDSPNWCRRPRGSIRYQSLQDVAAETNNIVLFELAKSSKKSIQDKIDEYKSLSHISFASMALSIFDLVVGDSSILALVGEAVGESQIEIISVNSGTALFSIILSVALPWGAFFWLQDRLVDDAEWVWCPVAAKKYAERDPFSM